MTEQEKRENVRDFIERAATGILEYIGWQTARRNEECLRCGRAPDKSKSLIFVIERTRNARLGYGKECFASEILHALSREWEREQDATRKCKMHENLKSLVENCDEIGSEEKRRLLRLPETMTVKIGSSAPESGDWTCEPRPVTPSLPPQDKTDVKRGDRVRLKGIDPQLPAEGTVEEVIEARGLVRVIVTLHNRPCSVDLFISQVERL